MTLTRVYRTSLEQLIVIHLAKIFPVLWHPQVHYRVHGDSLFTVTWDRWIQFTPSNPFHLSTK